MNKCYKCGRKEKENDQCACPTPEPKRCCVKCQEINGAPLRAEIERKMLTCKICPCHQAKPEEKLEGYVSCRLAHPTGFCEHPLSTLAALPVENECNHPYVDPVKWQCTVCKFSPSPVQEKECIPCEINKAGGLANHLHTCAPKKEKECPGIECRSKDGVGHFACIFHPSPSSPESWEEEFDGAFGSLWSKNGEQVFGCSEDRWTVVNKDGIKSWIAAKKKEWEEKAKLPLVHWAKEKLKEERASVRASTLEEVRRGLNEWARVMWEKGEFKVFDGEEFEKDGTANWLDSDEIAASIMSYVRAEKKEEKGTPSKQNP